jgi:hypothetical protein
MPDERHQEWMDGNNETREALRHIHGEMKDRGLLTGSMKHYWYSIFDALVYELAPEMQTD